MSVFDLDEAWLSDLILNLKLFTFCVNPSFIGHSCQTCCLFISGNHPRNSEILAPPGRPHSEGCVPLTPPRSFGADFEKCLPEGFSCYFERKLSLLTLLMPKHISDSGQGIGHFHTVNLRNEKTFWYRTVNDHRRSRGLSCSSRGLGISWYRALTYSEEFLTIMQK